MCCLGITFWFIYDFLHLLCLVRTLDATHQIPSAGYFEQLWQSSVFCVGLIIVKYSKFGNYGQNDCHMTYVTDAKTRRFWIIKTVMMSKPSGSLGSWRCEEMLTNE